ncbi:hypothetical protein JCM8115_003368 [Rhodotorula mucilaginosa]|uniref:Accessory factor associated with RNA polymerase II n=1 Tax=Rhodotorula mucilaginosa TaxID=5537 RepID=A0A9P7B6A7_RHOMI|nr:accessory factor associated with RNA polymerase II [Rhodotorula mucilaginosa]
MTSEDPLLLLRQALSSGQAISLRSSTGDEVFNLKDATEISFGHGATKHSFPKQTPTRFLSNPRDSVDDPAAPTYDLATLLLGYNERVAPFGDYLRKASEAGIAFISATDRRIVCSYLAGEGDIDGPEGRIRPLPAGLKRDAADAASSSTTAPLAGGAPPAKKARYVPDRDDQEKVKRMISIIDGPAYGFLVGPNEPKVERSGGAYHNRETVLRGERINNFESVRALVGPRLKQMKEDMGKRQPAQPLAPAGAKPQKKKQLNPIIMISPSSTALITMHNVKQLLEESRFIPSEDARREAAGASTAYVAEDVIQINHARATGSVGGAGNETRNARYFVVDSVEALSKFGGAGKLDEAWDRVVCVMTTGQEWQFKPYKWKEPKELFHNVKGVYPQWTADPPNAKIRSWNVSELRIDPSKRHIDKSTVADFWRQLEGWIQTNKPWLSF